MARVLESPSAWLLLVVEQRARPKDVSRKDGRSMYSSESEPKVEKQLTRLTREVFQIEAFVVWHCQREAEHLGRNAPAAVLLAIASHAESTLGALRLACARDGLRTTLDGNV